MRALEWQTRMRNESKSLGAAAARPSRDGGAQQRPAFKSIIYIHGGPSKSMIVGTRKAVNYA